MNNAFYSVFDLNVILLSMQLEFHISDPNFSRIEQYVTFVTFTNIHKHPQIS